MASPSDSDPIVVAPGPWKTKCTAYMIPIWTSASTAKNLPAKAYSPLEAQSSFASEASGKAQRSMGMVQLVRYTETPAGPYEEMVFVPGVFSYPFEETGKEGEKKTVAKSARRVTRIYVSQKHTAWNGRKNWNIPKHLAKFEWTDNSDGSTHVKVFPHDLETPYDPSESTPSTKPFFQCTLQPVKYTPSFPFRSSWLRFIGLGMSLVQPPVPDATGATKLGELAGSEDEERWCEVDEFYQASSKTSLVWADLKQGEGEEFENFWPGAGRWTVGTKLAEGVLEIGEGIGWGMPRGEL